MAYQTIVATNIDVQCGIQIQCTATGEPIGNVDAVVLKKRYYGGSAWKIIGTFAIQNVDDFNFTVFDADTRSGYIYDYLSVPMIDGIEQVGVGASCLCRFGGIYIADNTSAFVSLYNNKYTMKKNTQVSYITPLSGRFPRRVSNANTNYMTGSVTGLFLPFDAVGFPNKEKAREYKDDVLAMLTNGATKLLKTYDGNAWIISVDAQPEEDFSEFIGASTITFNWTQIGAVDTPPPTLSDYDSTRFWINAGFAYMDGMKNSKGVSFTLDLNGNAVFASVEQSITTLSIDDAGEAELRQHRPDDTSPTYTINADGELVVTA